MLRCAVDVRSSSIRLALWAFWENDPPVRLEARLITSRSTAQVLAMLETWRHWYPMDADRDWVIVGCKADAWPSRLASGLEEAGYTLQWIEDIGPLADGVNFLQSLQQSPLFMRAALMAHWPSGCQRNHLDGTVLDVQYAFLRSRLVDLEYDLCIEGRCPCPGHLAPTCPDCEFLAAFESPRLSDADERPESVDPTEPEKP